MRSSWAGIILLCSGAICFWWIGLPHKMVEGGHGETFSSKMDFYGRVVDQNRKPIAGASTSYILETDSRTASPRFSGPLTDADGRFKIVGKTGAGIFVTVQHPDYYSVDTYRRQFYGLNLTLKRPLSSATVTLTGFIYGKDLTLKGPPATAEEPALFVLRAKGKAEEPITVGN